MGEPRGRAVRGFVVAEVSAAVRDLASGKGFHFSDRGRALLKGFSEPTRLFRLDRSETD